MWTYKFNKIVNMEPIEYIIVFFSVLLLMTAVILDNWKKK